MSASLGYAVAAWLFLWGLAGVATSRNYVHLVVCLAVFQTSSYVLLLAVGWRAGGAAPVLDGQNPTGAPIVDPVMQALILTDVVVEATVMALLLALAIRVHLRTGSLDPDAPGGLKG